MILHLHLFSSSSAGREKATAARMTSPAAGRTRPLKFVLHRSKFFLLLFVRMCCTQVGQFSSKTEDNKPHGTRHHHQCLTVDRLLTVGSCSPTGSWVLTFLDFLTPARSVRPEKRFTVRCVTRKHCHFALCVALLCALSSSFLLLATFPCLAKLALHDAWRLAIYLVASFSRALFIIIHCLFICERSPKTAHSTHKHTLIFSSIVHSG